MLKIPNRSANVKSYNFQTDSNLSATGINLNELQLWTLQGNEIIPSNNDLIVSCNNLQVNQSYTLISDVKLKDNIRDIPNEYIDNLAYLKSKQYTFINDPLKRVHYGYIAQDVEKIYPNLVLTNAEQIKSINYIELIPILIEKINKLELEIFNLKK